MSATESPRQLRVFFLPLMSPGHMIPLVDIAKLFSRRPNVSVTIITTSANEPLILPSIAGFPSVNLLLIPFSFPDGHENLASIPKSLHPGFFSAFNALQAPLTDLLRRNHPDCIVSDSLYSWTSDTAISLGIPRIVFHATGVFPLCVHDSIHLHGSYKDDDINSSFIVRDLPDAIQLRRSELSGMFRTEHMLNSLKEAEDKSYGVVVNSFYELGPEYAELYKRKSGRRAWLVGPVSLANEESIIDRSEKMSNQEAEKCLDWLDKMEAGSVVYVCFGSLNEFGLEQMEEIASGLEDSGYSFVWVVRSLSDWKGDKPSGVIIKGWAPQLAILNHPAVGGFVTHCGWNSTLEGVVAGVAMATWPVEYEQFVNEKLIVEVLGIGVSVRRGDNEAVVKKEAIAEAVREVMGGGREGEMRRKKVKEYAAMAKMAMEVGGSSYTDLDCLIKELRDLSTTSPPN